ncbi:pkd2 [Symbiodinium natans]|uniref:Pkd2 protein n=1 Tax=Symbiodinium natans TaxID=878477 RepID=A0A812M2A1_9DINO|nr:pkd2 [Symbiodinium natans]
MSSMVMPALLSLLFALSFLFFAYIQQTEVSADMFRAASERFVNSPWQNNPRRTIHDVRGGSDVYKWVQQVFLNQLYMELPADGAPEGYCTATYPCRLSEGNVNHKDECSGPLIPGDRNCPSRLGVRASCCQQCVGTTCPEHSVPTRFGNLTANTSVLDVAANCAEQVPFWLTYLPQWKDDDPPNNRDENFTFCPERVGRVAKRGLMVGGYNLVLMGRLSLKRRKWVTSDSPIFSNAYPRKMPYRKTDAFSQRPAEEDMASFGQNTVYNYQRNAGFRRAGAFVEILNFDGPKHVILNKIAALRREGWFNLQQGSLVAELLVWNGNVERLLHTAIVFEHDFSGKTQTQVLVSSLAFNIHDTNSVSTYFLFFLYLVIIVCFVFFFRAQIEDISADYRAYLSEPMGYIKLALFCLCFYCIMQYFTIVFSYTFLNFRLPMKTSDFQEVAELTMNNEDLKVAVSVTTCLLFVQAIAECCTLIPQLQLLVHSMSVMKEHLAAFFVAFFIMVMGFALGGMFALGWKIREYGTMPYSILTVIEMMRGKSNYPSIISANHEFGDAYFLFFHFFFLIFQQFLLAILVIGYMKVRKRQADSEQVETPLRRIFRSVKSALLHLSANIRSRLISLQQIFFGTQATAKTVDYEQVARLRDKRATKPKIRNVLYEKRPGNDDESVDISKEIRLRAVEPFYPDGMMHYYVDEVEPESVAHDYKVQGFRLVGIFSKGSYDKEKFRSVQDFEQKYSKDPQQILSSISKADSLPVRLEFQGKVQPFSCECLTMAFLVTIFLIFVLQVARVQDSYSLTEIHRAELMGREWYEYHPTRIMDFRNISLNPSSYKQWMREAIYEGEMSCVGLLDQNAQTCIPAHGSDGDPFVRENWQLYVQSGSSLEALKLSSRPETADLDMSVSGFAPAAAEGMTVGFVPKGDVPVTTAIRFRTWNVGVMPNNHARVVLQIPCHVPVTNERFSADYPYRLSSLFRGCATKDCMGELLKEQQTCYSFDGAQHPAANVTGASTGIVYTYTTQAGAQGVVLGLGGTPAEAETVMDLLLQDHIHPISMTVQFVTYNGNMDMFTHSTVAFELEPTGVLSKNVHTVVYPLNIFTMGLTDFAEQRKSTNRALFITYVVAACLFLTLVLRDLLIQLQLTSLEKPWYYFIIDFFFEDVWNFLDVVCLVINGLVIDSIFRYMLIDGTFNLREGFQSWTDNFVFGLDASLNTQDAYEAFGKAARLYDTFITLSSLNGLCLLLRFAKYFRSVTSLRLVLTTLTAALQELFMISALIIIVLVAVVLLMHNRFGMVFHRYGTLESSSQSVFFFLIGSFDTADLYTSNPLFFLLVTVFFQVSFLVILNLLIAAIIYRWKDSRRDAEDFSVLSFWTLGSAQWYPFPLFFGYVFPYKVITPKKWVPLL